MKSNLQRRVAIADKTRGMPVEKTGMPIALPNYTDDFNRPGIGTA